MVVPRNCRMFSSVLFSIFSDGSVSRLHGHNFTVTVDVQVSSHSQLQLNCHGHCHRSVVTLMSLQGRCDAGELFEMLPNKV